MQGRVARPVRPFTEATRGEPGNLWFEWSRRVDDPHGFVLLEVFRHAQPGCLVGTGGDDRQILVSVGAPPI